MIDTLRFTEAGLTVRLAHSLADQDQVHRLRHKVFCEQLHWVPARADGRECDHYETGAVTLAVFTPDDRIVGLCRLIPGHRPFMLERDFKALVGPGQILRKGPDAAEATRLTALSEPTAGIRPGLVSALLYKGIYRWARAQAVRFLYLVVETRYLCRLRRHGFPCRAIGPATSLAHEMPCVAALLDWEAFLIQARAYPSAFTQWITETVPTPQAASPWRSPAPDCER